MTERLIALWKKGQHRRECQYTINENDFYNIWVCIVSEKLHLLQAVEYAKHIPKPKQSNQHFGYPPAPHKHVRDTHKNQVDNEGNKIVALEPVSGQRQSPAYSPTRAIELLNLDDLQRRHEEERQAAAEINYKLQQTAWMFTDSYKYRFDIYGFILLFINKIVFQWILLILFRCFCLSVWRDLELPLCMFIAHEEFFDQSYLIIL